MDRKEIREFAKQALWGPGERVGRITKDKAHYQADVIGKRCGLCDYYVNGGECRKVIGRIERGGTCLEHVDLLKVGTLTSD